MTHCTLCDLPVDAPVTDDAVEGTFCCRGCLEVARTLDDPATETRDAADTGPDPDDADGETVRVRRRDALCNLRDVHRSAGQQTTMPSLPRPPYPTGTMKLTYDADALSESALTDVVAGTGYDASLQATETDDGTNSTASHRRRCGTMSVFSLLSTPAISPISDMMAILDPSGQAGDYLLWNMAVMTGVVVGYIGWPFFGGVRQPPGRPAEHGPAVAMAAVSAFLSASSPSLGHTECTSTWRRSS